MSKFIEITLSTGEVQMLNTRFIQKVRSNQNGQTEILMQEFDNPVVTNEKYEVVCALLTGCQK